VLGTIEQRQLSTKATKVLEHQTHTKLKDKGNDNASKPKEITTIIMETSVLQMEDHKNMEGMKPSDW
jgi:hypothetical protein